MRKATANYNRGVAVGEILAWSDSGKRIAAPKSVEIPQEKPEVEFTAKRIIPANAKKLR
jgi:hypothetical protein